MSGIKYDSNKARIDLFPPAALIGGSFGMTMGAVKYSAHNWCDGLVYSRYHSAALRHLTMFSVGEDIDPETGLPHLAHAIDCVAILYDMTLLHPELDDRFKWSPEQLARLRTSMAQMSEVIAKLRETKAETNVPVEALHMSVQGPETEDFVQNFHDAALSWTEFHGEIKSITWNNTTNLVTANYKNGFATAATGSFDAAWQIAERCALPLEIVDGKTWRKVETKPEVDVPIEKVEDRGPIAAEAAPFFELLSRYENHQADRVTWKNVSRLCTVHFTDACQPEWQLTFEAATYVAAVCGKPLEVINQLEWSAPQKVETKPE